MCLQSFIALRCVLRKPWGFLENRFQEKQQLSSVLGPAFRGKHEGKCLVDQ